MTLRKKTFSKSDLFLVTAIVCLIIFFGILIIFIRNQKPPPVQKTITSTPEIIQTPTLSETITSINATISISKNETSVKVVKVIDGDTIEIEDGQKVRYIGIDTPETVDPRRTVACFGKEASEKNRELIEGKTVRLEKDVSEKDKYGRLLRYVYVDDMFINEYLLSQGYAKISTFPPDVRYVELFLAAESQAREKNLGLWKKCKS